MLKAAAIVLALVVGGLGVATAGTIHPGSVLPSLSSGDGGGSSIDGHNGTSELNDNGGTGDNGNHNGTQEYEGQDSLVT